jgi:hypothetical protein
LGDERLIKGEWGLMFDFDTEEGIKELEQAKIAHDIEVREREKAKLQEKLKKKVTVRKRKMPVLNVIRKYWEGVWGIKLPVNSCWRCGEKCKPHRAHIWARCMMELYTDKTDKEIDDVSNLHLLCSHCHKYSEMLYGWKPGTAYYEWFYMKRETPKENPHLPQIYNQEKEFGDYLTFRLFTKAGISFERYMGMLYCATEKEASQKEIDAVKQAYRNIITEGDKTGLTILCSPEDSQHLLKEKLKERLECYIEK